MGALVEPPSEPPSDAAPSSGASAAPALLGAAWDFVLLGPGATLLVTAVLGALWLGGATGTAAWLAANIALLTVGPHYAATYRRAYGSIEIVRDHPIVTILVPIILVAGAAAAVRWPLSFGPFYFLAYVAWSGFHYSRQSLGIAMIYPLRQKARLDAREKRLLALPLYASWIVSLIGLMRVGVATRNEAYRIVSEQLAPVHVPTWLLSVFLVPVAASFAGLALIASERRRRGTPLPRACWAVVAAQVVWFSVGLFHPYFNIVLVPVFHSLQYLALTGWHYTRGQSARRLLPFALYFVTVLVLGLVINPGLPIAFVPDGGAPRALTIAAALVSAINLHHFLLDGRIWRMREQRVAQAFAK